MKFLVLLITSLLKALLPALLQKARRSCDDADPQVVLKKRLRDKIRKTWLIWPVVFFIAGCGNRTVYVPDGTPVRLRETVKDVKAWVKDSSGQTIATRMNLPEGWYCLSGQ